MTFDLGSEGGRWYQSSVAGIQHEGRSKVAKRLEPGVFLDVIREPKNPYDRNAIALAHERSSVGYLPKRETAVLAPLFDARRITLAVLVVDVDCEDAEPKVDLVVALWSPKKPVDQAWRKRLEDLAHEAATYVGINLHDDGTVLGKVRPAAQLAGRRLRATQVLFGSTLAVSAPAEWLPDPTGRFEQRYWSGTAWTEHVFSAGVQSVDPP